MRQFSLPPVLRRLLDVVWISLLIFYILMGVSIVPFHGDESTLIYTTHDYAYQFIDRDLSMVTYDGSPAIDPMLQSLRLLDGRVHKYLGGLFWHLAGYTENDLNQPWLWGTDWNYNLSSGHIPSDGLLLVTRLASAGLMAVGVIAMFGIGMLVDGRITAYAASAFYALHPALLLNGRRSMMEGSLMGFSLLTVLAGLYFLRVYREKASHGWRVMVIPTLLLGLSGGITLASKHTGVLVIGIVFGACGLYVLVDAVRRERLTRLPRAAVTRAVRGLVGLFAAGVLLLLIFYAMNPAWWGDPIGRARLVAQMRTDLLVDQTEIFGSYGSLPERFTGFWRQAVIGQPMYYEAPGWEAFIGDQIAAYEASPWRGWSPGNDGLGGVVFLGGLMGGGIAYLARGHHRQNGESLSEDRKGAERWLISAWVIGMIVLVFVATPLEWQRYYLPVILPLCLLPALGISEVWQEAVVRRLNKG